MAIDNSYESRCRTFYTHTWTVWTCGDWITDGWAAWITPWTWTVCPLGSCTNVTVGADDVACAAGIDTYGVERGKKLPSQMPSKEHSCSV